MPANVDVDVGGQRMQAWSERALFWPAQSRLILSDLHLGKADTFRRHGVALPSGGTGLDLQRLSALIERTSAREVWILGDFLHGAVVPAWRQQWQAWRQSHRTLGISVLTGNHDSALHSAQLSGELEVNLLGPAVDEQGLAFRHAPTKVASLHVLCGHVHPVTRLPGLAGRWPMFLLGQNTTVLPAFSTFSGGFAVRLQPTDRFIACVATEVVASFAQAPSPDAAASCRTTADSAFS